MAVWPTESKLFSIEPQRSVSGPSNIVTFTRGAWVPEALRAKIAGYSPKTELGKIIKDMLWNWKLTPEMADELLGKLTDIVVMETKLTLQVIRHPNSPFLIGNNFIEDYGVVSQRVVTTTGVERIVDTFQSTANSMGTFKYHAFGLSSAAEAVGDVALGNECTTATYNSADRPTGTQTTGAAGPHVYMTTATLTVDAVTSGTPLVLQEHGIFNTSGRASTGLWDRSLTGTQTLSTGDSLSVQYSLTVNSGG